MIKYFRLIRRKLWSENKFKKYLLYAVGEIILVMIGILLALQVNNWNDQRKNNNAEQKLLAAIRLDLLNNKDRLKEHIYLENRTINQAHWIINHLDNREPYSPGLDSVFSQAIYSPDIVIAKTGYESLKLKGVDIIRDEILKQKTIYLFDVVYTDLIAGTVRLEDLFWPTSVLPMIHKHFRRVDTDQTMKLKPTNYQALLEDETYKNMIMNRVHFRKLALDLKEQALDKTQELLDLLPKDIKADYD